MKTTLMTKGSIVKNMIIFAIPILIGQVFQQLYNIIDSLIVGNFVGSESLGAVTSTGALSFLFIGLVSGVFLGSGVLISKYYGASDEASASNAIHTSVAFAIVLGVLLSVVGVIFTPMILKLMDTPDDIIELSTIYLRIIFSGGIFTVGYNCASSIYQSIGDTKSPLIFLIISSFINVVLDIVFVVFMDMGVAGAALATVVSQAVSTIISFINLFRTKQFYKVTLSKIKFHSGFVLDIIKFGVPSGIQNSVISLANVVVQSNINKFGSDAIAGNGAYTRIEGMVFIPITAFTFALTTFISQNLGAKEYDRVKKGASFGIISSMIMSVILGVIFYLFSSQIIGLFSDDIEVIKHGIQRTMICCIFYFLISFSYGVTGVLRGAGKSIIPMIVMLFSWCIIRVIYIEITIRFIEDVRVIYWAYPLTWLISSIIFFFLYKFTNWKQ